MPDPAAIPRSTVTVSTVMPFAACLRRSLLAVAICSAAASAAHAQSSLRIVVPLAAGGGADIVARALADQISHAQNVNAVVENRPGAGTVIGTEAVARAA